MEIWDQKEINSVEPSETLYNDGYPIDSIPVSGNINFLLNEITRNRIPVGRILPFMGIISPDGYLLCDGNSIGSENSLATHKSNNYKDLFILLWDFYEEAVVLPNGRNGNAESDWENNKNITLMNLKGVTLGGKSIRDNCIYNDNVNKTIGSEKVSLVEDELPEHQHLHGVPITARAHLFYGFENIGTPTHPLAFQGIDSNASPYTSPTGESDAHNNIQPTFVILNYIIKW